MDLIPICVFLTRGVGTHRHQLTAFEYALREAEIEQQNLVSVSSILPPGCELIDRESGVAALRPARSPSALWRVPRRMSRAGASAPAWGSPDRPTPSSKDTSRTTHGFGMTEQESSDYGEDLATTMLASTPGIEFDPDAAWDEREGLPGE
jgi:arginine decarboxylase